jgi:hypothetical protein
MVYEEGLQFRLIMEDDEEPGSILDSIPFAVSLAYVRI